MPRRGDRRRLITSPLPYPALDPVPVPARSALTGVTTNFASPVVRQPEETILATVEQTMIKVQRLLTGPMNLKIQLQGETIGVVFTDASTQIHMRVLDWGKNKDGEPRSLVRITAPLLRAVDPTPALYEYLAREAPRLWFGNIAVWDDEQNKGKLSLTLGHTLLGDYLDEEELRAAMYGILNSADDLDDRMQQRFGGKRWTDT